MGPWWDQTAGPVASSLPHCLSEGPVSQGMAGAVLRVLEARPARRRHSRQRILACTDAARLDRWLTAAVSCASVDALLALP